MEAYKTNPLFMKVTVRRYAKPSDLPPDVKKAIKQIIDYSFDFAAEDYTFCDRDEKDGHAFDEMHRVLKWLED